MVNKKEKTVSKRQTTKKTVAASEKGPVEAKLDDILEKSLEGQNFVVPMQSKGGSSLPWIVFSIILLIAFVGLLTYEYYQPFKNLVNGWLKIPANSATVSQTEQTAETFNLNLTAIYNMADNYQKDAVGRYGQNIEQSLANTKVKITELDYNDPKAKTLLAQTEAISVPLFITDENILKHPKYQEFASSIGTKDGVYFIKSQDGMEYFKLPPLDKGRRIGADASSAKVTILEYLSYSCGYCKKFHETKKEILAKYGNDVAFVIKNFDRGGPDKTLAQAAECAADQGQFESFTDQLFANQDKVFAAYQGSSPEADLENFIKASAEASGVGYSKLKTCLDSKKYEQLITDQTQEAISFGVMGTPSLFFNNRFFPGAIPTEDAMQVIEQEIAKAKK